jgi:hypothetical protein
MKTMMRNGVIIAMMVSASIGTLYAACNNLTSISLTSGPSCDSSPCSYNTYAPACTQCSSSPLPGYNLDCEHGTDYTSNVTGHKNGDCVNGQCSGGDPTVSLGMPCYNTTVASGCSSGS